MYSVKISLPNIFIFNLITMFFYPVYVCAFLQNFVLFCFLMQNDSEISV